MFVNSNCSKQNSNVSQVTCFSNLEFHRQHHMPHVGTVLDKRIWTRGAWFTRDSRVIHAWFTSGALVVHVLFMRFTSPTRPPHSWFISRFLELYTWFHEVYTRDDCFPSFSRDRTARRVVGKIEWGRLLLSTTGLVGLDKPTRVINGVIINQSRPENIIL